MESSAIIINLGGKDYELTMKYRNMKFLKSKFGISFSDMEDDFEENIEKIIYSAMKPKDQMPPITLEQLENYLDDFETLEEIFEIVGNLMKKTFPKEYAKLEDKEDDGKKKKLLGMT